MDVNKTAQDAAYIAVGFGVIAFQRAQVLRQDLTKSVASDRTWLETQLGDLRGELAKLASRVEEALEPVAKELDSRLDEVEARLPEAARGLVSQARTQAKDAQAQVRSLLAA